MRTLTPNSKATMEFTLHWQSKRISHQDSLWSNQVNLWRDQLPAELARRIEGKKEGDKVSVVVPANHSSLVFPGKRIVKVPSGQFYPPGNPVRIMEARVGRFYPQGWLHKIDNVFSTSLAPARCLDKKERLTFDLAHPLADRKMLLEAKIIAIHESGNERGGRCEEWLERSGGDGVGMQARYQDLATDFFSRSDLLPRNQQEDTLFYARPRMVQHLDSTARKTIRHQYGRLIPSGARVLDLMASWDSHLPDDLELANLTLLGLNQEELDANPRGTESRVQDLNRDPRLAFDDNSLDAVVCTASVEYLRDPLTVFGELERILRPGGIILMAFSNRWFPEKAVRIWTKIHEFERLGMVLEMLLRTRGLTDYHSFSHRGLPRPEEDPHQEFPFSDPVFMAWARKES